MNSRKKFPYYRSRAHLMAVASLDCQLCGRGGPSQAAHSNQAIHGKGRSIKASDEFTAALCPRCHEQVDSSYVLSGDQRAEMWALAHVRTRAELMRRGMWKPTKETA